MKATEEKENEMITVKSLIKTYGSGRKAVQALNGIDLEIGSGMFGLLGPNGAGKTTLMRILAGIVNPSRGTIRIDGHDIATDAGKQAVKSVLGYLPQELGMYPELTAEQFVDYMAILKGLDDPRRRAQRVEQVLEMVGLHESARRKIKGFSGVALHTHRRGYRSNVPRHRRAIPWKGDFPRQSNSIDPGCHRSCLDVDFFRHGKAKS
jgi:ABC-type Na+ transport system ATPase subunit NatA